MRRSVVMLMGFVAVLLGAGAQTQIQPMTRDAFKGATHAAPAWLAERFPEPATPAAHP